MSHGLNFRAWDYDPRSANAVSDYFWFLDFETSAIPSPQTLGMHSRLTPLSVTMRPYKWGAGGELVPATELGPGLSANIIPRGVPRSKREGFLRNILNKPLSRGGSLGELLDLTPKDFTKGGSVRGTPAWTEQTTAQNIDKLLTQTPGRVILGGHKVHEFDVPVLDAMMARANLPGMEARQALVADTLRVARQIEQLPGKQLGQITEYFGLDMGGQAHLSDVDVPASASIYGPLLKG